MIIVEKIPSKDYCLIVRKNWVCDNEDVTGNEDNTQLMTHTAYKAVAVTVLPCLIPLAALILAY